MVTSIKNLKNEIDDRLTAGGLSALACCQLQNAQTILNNCIVTSVADTASLPSPIENEGRFIYIEDINEYRFSNQTWTDDLDTTLLVSQRQLWAWGLGFDLGDGTTVSKCSPVREFCSAIDWCQVSAGGQFTGAIKTSGELWMWGSGSCGRLGDGALTVRYSPVREICSATDWCRVSASVVGSTAAIKTTGQLWVWGNNGCGRLGDGSTTNRCSPVRERCSATDWCQVSTASSHTAAIKTSGQLWTWGAGNCGVLGDGTTVLKCSPVREICSATNWCQVSAGNSAAVTRNVSTAIKTSGELWAWGYNRWGNVGDGTTVSKCSPVRERCSATDWCQVSAGGCMIAAIKTSGQLWTWGAGSCGRLGDGALTNRCSPVREFCSATDWCQVSAGSYCSILAIKTSGQLWVWGGNNCGKLGDGTITQRCSPVREICSATSWYQVSAGRFHSAAIQNTTKGFFE